MLVENDDRNHHGLVNSALIFLTIHPLPVSRPASCLHNVFFLPLLPPGLLVTPYSIDPPRLSTHPRFCGFMRPHLVTPRDRPDISHIAMNLCKAEAAASHLIQILGFGWRHDPICLLPHTTPHVIPTYCSSLLAMLEASNVTV